MSSDSKKQFRHSDSASDSDGSEDEDLSLKSSNHETNSISAAGSKSHKKRSSRKAQQEWDVLEGLKEGQACPEKPEKFQGYLMKKRKWPMKGWHKRFFVLDKGSLVYAKTSLDIQKGKYHGLMDIALAVITYKRRGQRIDIDAEEQVHHLKLKDKPLFEDWLSRLKQHRLYRQHEIMRKGSARIDDANSPVTERPPLLTTANFPDYIRQQPFKRDAVRQSSFKGGQGRVVTWLLDSSGFELSGKNLQSCQADLSELRDLLEKIQALPLSSDATLDASRVRYPGTPRGMQSIPTLLLPSPTDRLHASASNPNLLNYASDISSGHAPPTQLVNDPSFMAGHEFRIQELKLREHFLSKSESVFVKLKDLLNMVSSERERIRNALEQELDPSIVNPAGNLKNALIEAQKQNADLRARLSRIHADSSLSDLPLVQTALSPLPTVRFSPASDKINVAQSLSLDSFSLSEYYDAEENFGTISDSSSEPSDEEVSSEISEDGTEFDHTQGGTTDKAMQAICATGRRSRLPVPKPEIPDVSLWGLLYRNIGKDLTKISMPVTLNEPLSMLQRLCEELEYSELLDKAAEYDDPLERMIYVAAFAVSGYASSYYREGHKPFNPLLGETYECIREDKGWKFIAEQVCHHPPISACYCESKNFKLWQDVRMKTKFWGKSMEIQPLGTVNVVLPKYRDHYKWNKVTTCVHNLLGGQRWADQYGEMTIVNGSIVCKITFTKGTNNASPKRYEVYGSINTGDGKVVHNLFGKWNEAFFCGHAATAKCIWRPGAMPENSELYYGFTRFAIELNELDPDMSKFLPPTDSRFRPDQRLLEEGKIAEAEAEKLRLESVQRERRKNREMGGEEPKPMWFKKILVDGKTETYEYSNKYWEARKDPGFSRMSFRPLF
ncbi:oxysterol-binding protein-related protein 6 [Biomphalaria pfeifferi]|uniref:Oxysterol-binding protein n=1 Tax=Biomphalaria pfeifferi TaxID=112525 RepID=A0AAD8C840_BIOPF|nr:oxysterol-binding protein-related protein 6 [Biomphalaria pfeifferi]